MSYPGRFCFDVEWKEGKFREVKMNLESVEVKEECNANYHLHFPEYQLPLLDKQTYIQSKRESGHGKRKRGAVPCLTTHTLRQMVAARAAWEKCNGTSVMAGRQEGRGETHTERKRGLRTNQLNLTEQV